MTSSNGNIFRVTGLWAGNSPGTAGKSPVPGEFPAQRPVTQSFDVFFDLPLNKRFSKQSWVWWFETLSRPLWRHRNGESVALEELQHQPLRCWSNIPVPLLTWFNFHPGIPNWYRCKCRYQMTNHFRNNMILGAYMIVFQPVRQYMSGIQDYVRNIYSFLLNFQIFRAKDMISSYIPKYKSTPILYRAIVTSIRMGFIYFCWCYRYKILPTLNCK